MCCAGEKRGAEAGMSDTLIPNVIWMYWENKPGRQKPGYLQLCEETIRRHSGGYEVRVLDERSVLDYIDLPDKVLRLEEIAHKADYIRFHLLARYGGVWLDADVVLLRSIADAIDPFIGQRDFLGYGREPGKPSINFMASTAESPLMMAQCAAIARVLAEKRVGFFRRKLKLVWTEIGHDTLWELARDYPYYHHERAKIAPIFWEDWEQFLSSDAELDELLRPEPFMVMLYNDFMRKPLQDMSREEVFDGDMLISKLFRHALS